MRISEWSSYVCSSDLAFAVVVHLRGRTAIADYSGLGESRPSAALALTVSFLSLVGIPPLGGFLGKLMLLRSTIEAGYAWLAAFAVANTVVSLFYYLRVIGPSSEERRVGKECVSTCSSRWSPYH